jgi:Tol biopolymer transport system component
MKRASVDLGTAVETRPNGKIAFLRNRGGAVDVFVVNPSGMTPMNLTRSRPNELYVDWSPNGRHVVFTRFGKGPATSSGSREAGPGFGGSPLGQPATKHPGGRPTALPSRSIGLAKTVRQMSSSSMPGGRLLPDSRPTRSATTSVAGLRRERRSPSTGACSTPQFDIWVVNVDGSGEMQLTDDPGDEFSPVFSPDAARIAFMRRLGDQWDIFVMNADGTNVTRLTDDPLDDAFPQWSPQGERILFSRGRLEGTPRLDVVVMNADGSQERLLIDHPADDFSPTWSPDGRWVTFVSDRSSNWELYVIGSEGERLNRITRTRAFEFDPSWGSRP